MSSTGLSQRLAKFKQNFSQILGPKRQGYSEVGLNQPLVSSHAQSDDEYFQKHGVLRPGSRPPAGDQYQVPGEAYAGPGQNADMAYAASASTAIPDEADELRALAGLARDAGEILFEMAAMHDETEAAQDMLEKSQQLEAQLRGMIGDFKGGDETAVAQALEAFDILDISLTEYKTAVKGETPSDPTAQAANQQPPAASNPFQANPFGGASTAPIITAPGQKPKADEEPPLISFD
ncbi:hypothetical protein COCSUDRAFT_48293 [Coccomyxa subellipsoidea C-169]|uniref:GAT domain-containing protein n=1 Tax=Coccomyxa subellipsoidea (strain C-169) TaxID=574566 RepID=I0YRX2_COCSC|nr:hypothetical protein COCSUDRAFT_48293 [Coccomyxa subellipsoidea C-169]EIE21141.1 hypothetical protein COCSUDRAFT_48293 [Coccomyxa subellipsoidea C-169]|eukprot:XP_005645685.1 hypothetical protein COCSUDRAFT_48293 [Coccomyxa subellipsoidea C-169]